jgi:DNA repair exonuclease SbcCD ATPase subunit
LSRKISALIVIGMDERRKIIGELNEKRREQLQSRSQTLEALGKSLIERLDEGRFPGGEGGEYRRVKQEIAESDASIESIEGALARIKELDEEISVKLEERSDREEEAADLYTRLGRKLMEGDFPDGGNSNRNHLELLLSRNNSLEERLQDLDERDGGGIFSWFSKGVQSMVINASVKKNIRQMDRIYLQTGKHYAQKAESRPSPAGDSPEGGTSVEEAAPSQETALLLRDTLAQRRIIAELEGAAGELEGEKRKIKSSFGFREKPSARIKILERQNLRRQEELRELYLKVGEKAAADKFTGEDLLDEDRAKLDKARRCRESADERGREIEKLEGAIAIDAEQEKIAKLERAISKEKERISAERKNIAELKGQIDRANKRIADTRKYIDEIEGRG